MDYELRIEKTRKILESLKKLGFRIKGPIYCPLRNCDDVPKYLERMKKAHEATAKSTLKFRGLELIAT